MKRIPLRDRAGETIAHALVDDEDFEWLNRWRWSLQRGYAVRVTQMQGRRGPQIGLFMHREILGLVKGEPGIDHRNGNGLDNQKPNLRLASNAENAQNRRPRRSATGYRGVKPTGRGKFAARATLNYKEHYLGVFDTPEEADAAVKTWRRENMPFSEEAA